MSLFGGITIFLVAYIAIGGVLLGYQYAKKKGDLDDAEILACLLAWPVWVSFMVFLGVIYFPTMFGNWLYKMIEAVKK